MRLRPSLALLTLLAAAPAQAATSVPDLLADLAPGLSARVLIRAGDKLSDGTTFAPKNDLTAYVPLNAREGLLMVGHEIRFGQVGGLGGRMTRLFLRDGQVAGGRQWVSGMHNNCAGSLTPWNTILTCEEYPHDTYAQATSEERRAQYLATRLSPKDPRASFGWTYEVTPFGGTPAGAAQRRTAMGRFSHESAEVYSDREVYLTEDFEPGFLYKFVADRPRDLSAGKLYAYVRDSGCWVRVHDVVNAHHDAEAAGATKFVRLEDVKKGPDGALYVSETGSLTSNDPFGRVLRLDPRTNRMTVFAEGDGTHLAQPDNLIFDPQGNLLVCEDQFGPNLKQYGPNELLRRDKQGRWSRLAAILPGGEPSGPTFMPDGKTLVFSVLAGDRSALVALDGYR